MTAPLSAHPEPDPVGAHAVHAIHAVHAAAAAPRWPTSVIAPR